MRAGSAEPLEEADGIVGRVYLERGQLDSVLARRGGGGGPRNVMILRADRSIVVRPFRELRRPH